MRRSPRLAQSPCHQNRANWSSDLSPTFAKSLPSKSGLATIAKLTAAERKQVENTLYRTSRTLQKLPERVTQEVVRRLASRNEMVANAASKDEARRAIAQLTATRVYRKVVETVRERNACLQNQTSGKTDYSLRAVALNESIVTTAPSEPQLLKRYAEDIGVPLRKVRKICAQRAAVGTTAFWKFQRKVRKDVTNPETLNHIRRFFMTRGQPRNAGVVTTAAADRRGAWNRDFYVGKRGKKGDRQPGTQRLFLGETPKRAHQSWLKTVPNAGPKVKVVGYTVFWREKPEHVFPTAPRETCGCVHHAVFDTIAGSLSMIRKELHTPAGESLGRLYRGSSSCKYSARCKCTNCSGACRPCNHIESGRDMRKLIYCHGDCDKGECACTPTAACALGQCDHCGWDVADIFAGCECEDQNQTVRWQCYRRVDTGLVNKAGRKKTENKAVPRTGQYSEYIQELNDAWRFFAIHDYVAKQQATAFHQQMENLQEGEAMLIMDFSENFTFLKWFELQMDFFQKKQTTLFIGVLIRRRTNADRVAEESDYQLPANITADVHIFISDDKHHDAAAVQTFMTMMQGNFPSGLKTLQIWSDGARQHFKSQIQFGFLAVFALSYTLNVVWNYFQSCHGKGMQDGFGAWVKQHVARACLAGVGIDSAEAFYAYCVENLNAEDALTRGGKAPFTTGRMFYHVTHETIESTRSLVAVYKPWPDAVEHFYCFWATPTTLLGWANRRWLSCFCRACTGGELADPSKCVRRKEWLAKGVDSNLHESTKLIPVSVVACQVQELFDKQNQELTGNYARQLKVGDAVAMRCEPTLKGPVQKKAIGTGTTIHEVDEDDSEDSDESDELDEFSAQQDRFWLAVVVQGQRVNGGRSRTLRNRNLKPLEPFILVDWLIPSNPGSGNLQFHNEGELDCLTNIDTESFLHVLSKKLPVGLCSQGTCSFDTAKPKPLLTKSITTALTREQMDQIWQALG